MEESRNFRYRVGDKLAWNDQSEWPPVYMEGELVGFDNEELTYLVIDFGDDKEKVLTEDEVTKIS